MKVFAFRSIRTQIMTATTLLIVTLVGSIVWVWVVGDAVNLASRLEGLTKQYNCNILVTESVVNSLYHPESFCLRLVDKSVKVKGKDEAIAIYEVKL